MKFSYFPGCTLKTKAKALDHETRACAEALGITLEEIPQWQCCGAVYPQAKDEIATKLSAVRSLYAAEQAGNELVTVCSACYHVIKRVNRDMQTDRYIASRVNNYLKLDTPYSGQTNVLHFLEVLRDRLGFEELRKRVVNPLTGRKIGAYYGCLLLRPGKEMEFDNPENPSIMENFLRALGAEPVIYAQRNECCGGYQTLENKNIAVERATAVTENARNCGADALITACPLCLYNLKQNADNALPVFYFTQLLAEALGLRSGGCME